MGKHYQDDLAVFHICVAHVKATVQAERTFSIRIPADLSSLTDTSASVEDNSISSVPEIKRNLLFSFPSKQTLQAQRDIIFLLVA